MPAIPVLRGLRQDTCCEIEASLGYGMIFKTAWAMYCEALSKRQELGVRKKKFILSKSQRIFWKLFLSSWSSNLSLMWGLGDRQVVYKFITD